MEPKYISLVQKSFEIQPSDCCFLYSQNQVKVKVVCIWSRMYFVFSPVALAAALTSEQPAALCICSCLKTTASS